MGGKADQLDVKKCVDELIQRLNVPDEPPKYVLSPLQVEVARLKGGAK